MPQGEPARLRADCRLGLKLELGRPRHGCRGSDQRGLNSSSSSSSTRTSSSVNSGGINIGRIRHVVVVRPTLLFRNVRSGVFSGRTDTDACRKQVRLRSGGHPAANALVAHTLRTHLGCRLVGREGRSRRRTVDFCRGRRRLWCRGHRCCRLRAHLTNSRPEGLQSHERPPGVIRFGEMACRGLRASIADHISGHDRKAPVVELHTDSLPAHRLEPSAPEPSAKNRRDAPEQRRKRQLTGSFNSTRIFSTIRVVRS